MKKQTAQRPFLTVRELQDLVPLGRAGVYRLARSIGKRFGRRLLVSREAFEKWVITAGGAS